MLVDSKNIARDSSGHPKGGMGYEWWRRGRVFLFQFTIALFLHLKLSQKWPLYALIFRMIIANL